MSACMNIEEVLLTVIFKLRLSFVLIDVGVLSD